MSDIIVDTWSFGVESYGDILHLHCQSCFSVSCTEQQNCTIIRCPYGCGMRFHGCKADDHKILCLIISRPCPNFAYGCPYKISRQNFAKHLDICPAGVVRCGMEWNRYPVYSRVREHWIPFPQVNPPLIKGQLDIELAFSDQKKLQLQKIHKMQIGHWNLSKIPNRHKIDQRRIEKLESLLGKIKISSLNCNLNDGMNELVDNSNSSYVISEDRKGNSSECSSDIVCHALESGTNDNDICCLNDLVSDGSEDIADNNAKELNLQIHVKENGEETARVCTLTVEQYITQMAKKVMHADYQAIAIPAFPKRFIDQVGKSYHKTLGLNIIIETIPKFQQNYPMYSFPCKLDLRRDQYCSHFKNVHDDIHGGLNTWIQQRCPLAQYGCPFIRHNLKPEKRKYTLVFDHDIGNFGVRTDTIIDNHQTTVPSGLALLSLPFEVIERIVSFLDSFSINQISRTCKVIREVCQALVRKKGIVVLEWKRGAYTDGTVCWKIHKKRWLYTPSFSPVRRWVFTDEPSIGEHMKHCQYFIALRRTKDYKFPMDNLETVRLIKGGRSWRR